MIRDSLEICTAPYSKTRSRCSLFSLIVDVCLNGQENKFYTVLRCVGQKVAHGPDRTKIDLFGILSVDVIHCFLIQQLFLELG